MNTPVEIPRDRWGRPLIVPPGGGESRPYTRVSTLAKTLDDQSGLMSWKQRKTAEGLTRRPDLALRVAGALANGDPDTDWPTKKALTAICSEAMDAAGASTGASTGTGLHALTEAIDLGRELEFVPDHVQDRLDAYRAAMAGYVVLDVETFVVCDELQAAGTFDRMLLTPEGNIVVADLKTGKSEADWPSGAATQIAVYAHGVRYDPATGERTPLHADLDMTTGLLIHMPAATGGCDLIPLDIVQGWASAQLAVAVRAVRALKAPAWKRVTA